MTETKPPKVRVTQNWLEAILGPLRPKWDVKVGEVTLATFLGHGDAVWYAFMVADRAAARAAAKAGDRS